MGAVYRAKQIALETFAARFHRGNGPPEDGAPLSSKFRVSPRFQ